MRNPCLVPCLLHSNYTGKTFSSSELSVRQFIARVIWLVKFAWSFSFSRNPKHWKMWRAENFTKVPRQIWQRETGRDAMARGSGVMGSHFQGAIQNYPTETFLNQWVVEDATPKRTFSHSNGLLGPVFSRTWRCTVGASFLSRRGWPHGPCTGQATGSF